MFSDTTKGVIGLSLMGAAVGVGHLLNSSETLTLRVVVGRAMTSGGLGMAAAAVLTWLPELSFYAQLGVAAAFASLGTSALERMIQRMTGGA